MPLWMSTGSRDCWRSPSNSSCCNLGAQSDRRLEIKTELQQIAEGRSLKNTNILHWLYWHLQPSQYSWQHQHHQVQFVILFRRSTPGKLKFTRWAWQGVSKGSVKGGIKYKLSCVKIRRSKPGKSRWGWPREPPKPTVPIPDRKYRMLVGPWLLVGGPWLWP